jgi:hypothetical protein
MGKRKGQMTQEQKIIKGKVGLLKLAQELGNVSQLELNANSASKARASTTAVDHAAWSSG